MHGKLATTRMAQAVLCPSYREQCHCAKVNKLVDDTRWLAEGVEWICVRENRAENKFEKAHKNNKGYTDLRMFMKM